MIPIYRYRATLVRVIDGDTFVLQVDLGFRVSVQVNIRVHDYSAPELREFGGQEAKAKATVLLNSTKDIVVQTYRDIRSFERWIADLWIDGVLFSERMLHDLPPL